jgi:peptide/nickel transport system ATP-binding protein
MNESEPLVKVEDLWIEFQTRRGIIKAIQGVTLTMEKGEILGIVGETGSGKSVTSLAIMGLLDGNGRIIKGNITYQGEVIASPENQPIGKTPPPSLAMIFQSPRSALNPIRPVRAQVIDVLKTMHDGWSEQQYEEEAVRLLREVQMDDVERRIFSYPFELSGGICQRILIAMALARKPKLLFADEPTTGLDVLTQEAIFELILHATDTYHMSTVLISHDLGLISQYAQRIGVMFQGKLVEVGPTEQIFYAPKHPYTGVLVASSPGMMKSFDELKVALQRWTDYKKDQIDTHV